MKNNLFEGRQGLGNFLNPKNFVAPLVELPPELNPYCGRNVRMFVKMESLSPLLNIKSIPAWRMLADAPKGKKYLVESSSGNTAMSLAVLGRYFGFEKMKAYVSADTAAGKIKSLLLFGSDVEVIEGSGIERAKKDGEENDWYNPNQYANESNPKAHEEITGPQIYEQLDGRIDVFAGGLGTSGTTLGVARYLRRMKNDIKIISLVRGEGESVPGPRTRTFLEAVELDWERAGDVMLEVGQKESYEHSLKLCQAGIMAGPSTGFNYAGLLKYLKTVPKDRPLNAVFIACDTPFPYMDDYFKILPPETFPQLTGTKKT